MDSFSQFKRKRSLSDIHSDVMSAIGERFGFDTEIQKRLPGGDVVPSHLQTLDEFVREYVGEWLTGYLHASLNIGPDKQRMAWIEDNMLNEIQVLAEEGKAGAHILRMPQQERSDRLTYALESAKELILAEGQVVSGRAQTR